MYQHLKAWQHQSGTLIHIQLSAHGEQVVDRDTAGRETSTTYNRGALALTYIQLHSLGEDNSINRNSRILLTHQ